jgi:hypothetical protein
MAIHGARFEDSKLQLVDGVAKLPLVHLRWEKKASASVTAESNGIESASDLETAGSVLLPVYLNEDRSEVLFSCVLEIEGDRVEFVKRSVALTA